jgi:hypothetical protein
LDEHRIGLMQQTGRGRDVRFGSKADMCSAIGHVRFTPESGHVRPIAKKLPILADSPENKRSPAKGQLRQFCRLLPLGQRRPTRAHGET